jgi:hypothetical protein
MVPVARSLLVTVLCTGLGLGIAACDAPAPEQACLTCAHTAHPVVFAYRVRIDAQDFVAPEKVVAPARPPVAAPEHAWPLPASVALHDDVLDLAPKTSPPA